MSETSNNNLRGILKNINNQKSDLLDKINEILNNVEIIIDKKSIDLKKVNEEIFSDDNFKKIFYKKLRKINRILRDKGFNDEDNILINENNIKDFRNLIIHELFEKSIKIKENIEFEDLSEYNNKSLFSSHLSLNESNIKDYHEKIKNIREKYILIINNIKSNLNEETKEKFYDDFEYLEEKLKNFEVLDNKEKILNLNKEIIDFIERKSIINKIYNSLDEDKKKKNILENYQKIQNSYEGYKRELSTKLTYNIYKKSIIKRIEELNLINKIDQKKLFYTDLSNIYKKYISCSEDEIKNLTQNTRIINNTKDDIVIIVLEKYLESKNEILKKIFEKGDINKNINELTKTFIHSILLTYEKSYESIFLTIEDEKINKKIKVIEEKLKTLLPSLDEESELIINNKKRKIENNNQTNNKKIKFNNQVNLKIISEITDENKNNYTEYSEMIIEINDNKEEKIPITLISNSIEESENYTEADYRKFF